MKNTTHKSKPSNNKETNNQAKKVITAEDRMASAEDKANADATRRKELQGGKVGELAYRVNTKRDSNVLMAFITFNYRVFHPNITGRMLFYGALIFVPGFFVKPEWAKILFFALGAFVILLALTRQYISLAMTKSSDYDYKAGTEFTYDFTTNDMSFYRNDKLSSYAKYKDITGFYYDDDYYYLVLKNHEFHILPKAKFLTGNAADFDGFIYKKSHKTCKWIPNKLKDKMAKKRAARNLN